MIARRYLVELTEPENQLILDGLAVLARRETEKP